MARKTVKKARKSGKSGSGESQKAESIQPEPVVENAKKQISKTSEIRCEFCNKIMNDEKTRKIHQRNCKPKVTEPPVKKENDIQVALLQMKDTFEDQRQSMAKDFREREDHLQRELEEVKTVLRMEIDRHRKELERISKVEKDVAEKQAAPDAAPQPTEPRPAELQHARMPKAIDLIPMHIPSIPKRIFHPLDENESIPDLADDIKIKPEAPGLNRAAVEEVVRELMGKNMPVAPAQADTGNLGGKLNQLAGRMDLLDGKLERGLSELRKAMERLARENDAKRVEKELEKISEKVNDIMEDSGYGERLSVSKIPPTILEIVYQAILDDVHLEIVRTKGAQDADRIARSALEEVRLKTSGSELFKFDGRKIVTDNLAKSIEANLISAKQIQTTYDVLMDRLLETVPQHKAKNFTGMIKIKSQEFAVDRATKLTKDLLRIDKQLDSTSHMVAAMAANISAQTLAIHEKIDQINEKALASKADREDLDALKAKLDGSSERFMRLADEFTLLKAEMEMKSSIRDKEQVADHSDSDVFLTPGEEPFIPAPDVPEDGIFTAMPKTIETDETPASIAPDDSQSTEMILAAISGGADSKTAITKQTGLDADIITRALATLVEGKKVIEKKSGKRSRYTTLELEMNKARDEPTPDSKGKKAGKASKAPEPAAELPPEPDYKPGVIVLEDSPEDALAEPAPRKKKAKKMLDEEPEEPVPEVIPVPEPLPEPREEPAPKGRKKSRKTPEERPEPQEQPAPKSEKKPAPEEPEPESQALDDIPILRKSLSELSEEESQVLEAIGDGTVTLSGVQSKVGKHLKRFALLRALRVLIDSGHVGISTKGRMELYHRINVEKMDIPIEEKRKKEVK